MEKRFIPLFKLFILLSILMQNPLQVLGDELDVSILPPPNAGKGEVTMVNQGVGSPISLSANVFTNINSSSDPGGTVDSLVLTNFPTNVTKITVDGTDYTSLPAAGIFVHSDQDGHLTSQVSFVPNFPGNGTVVFNFKAIDNDGNRSSNTGTGTINLKAKNTDPVCYYDVKGNSFDWSYSDGALVDGSYVTITILQPGTDGGFIFDFYELNNSFNLKINGTKVAIDEIQFDTAASSPTYNVRFKDGDRYSHEVPAIWNLHGDSTHPILRMKITPTGEISMLGSKTSGGSLHPLELYNGNAFNNISWNQSTLNAVQISQKVRGATVFKGAGFGRNVTPCRYKVTGHIYNDINGLTDSRIDNHPNDLNGISDLYVVATDPVADTVAGVSAAVSTPDGGYAVDSLIDGNYDLILIYEPVAANLPNIGASATSVSASLPAIWRNTGEYLGTGAGNDLSVDGKLNVTVHFADLNQANFGIRKEADLSITKDDGKTTFSPGDTLTYTIEAENVTGPADVTGATVIDNAPANTNIIGWTATTTGGASILHSSGSGNINEKVDLPVGGKVTYLVKLKVPSDFGSSGDLTNKARVKISNDIGDPDITNNQAVDTDTNNPKADLSITKTDGQTIFTPGETLTYTVTIENANGPSDVSDAIVTDHAPANTNIVSWTASTSGGASVDHSSGVGDISDTVDLPVGGKIVYTVNLKIPANYGVTGDVSNTAKVDLPTDVTDPDLTNNQDTDTDTNKAKADLSITKDDGQIKFSPGDTLIYTIIASNTNGPSDVLGATIIDNVPANTNIVSWSVSAMSGGASVANTTGTGDINETVDLPVGGKITYTVKLAVGSNFGIGDLSNTAKVEPPSTVVDTDNSDNQATDTDTNHALTDLSITKDDGQTAFTPGATLSYTIVVENVTGPSDVVGATVTDNAPANTDIVSWSTSTSGGAAVTNSSGVGDLNETVNVPVGGKIIYTVNLLVHSDYGTGDLTNTANISLPVEVKDLDNSNNQAKDTDTSALKADLSVTKDDGQVSFTPGDTLIYTIDVENVSGPSDVLGAVVTDNAPANTSIVSWTATTTGGASASTSSGTGNMNETVDVPVGGKVSYTVKLAVPSDYGVTGNISNTAKVALPADVTDPDLSNNQDTDTDTNDALADLSITKDDGQVNFTPGDTLTYTIVVENTAGPSDVLGAIVTDNAPANTDIVSWTTAATGSASVANPSGTGNINETVDLPVGGKIIYTVILATHTNFNTSTLTNTSKVSLPSSVTDPDNSNNQDADTDNSQPITDLSITKTDGTGGYFHGTTTSYTVVVKNDGPSDVFGATVIDNAPSSTSISSWSAVLHGGATGTTSGSGNLNENVNIPVGDSIVYTINVAIPSGFMGPLTNTATVSAATDPDNSNNSATDTDYPKVDLSVTKTDGQTAYTPGEDVAYTITVKNLGPNNVHNAKVTDVVPSGTTITGWTATFTNATGTASGSGNINEMVDILAGGQVVYTVTVSVPSDQRGDLINTAKVAGHTGVFDPDLSNNTAKDKDTLLVKADLSMTKDDGQTTFSPGDTLIYTIVVENAAGPSDVLGAMVTDHAPANTDIVNWSAAVNGGASVLNTSGTGDLNESVDLPMGSKITYTVKLAVHSDFGLGDISNTAKVTPPATVIETDNSNNSQTDTDTNAAEADLSVTKTDGQTNFTPADTLTYTIAVENATGPSDVLGAVVKDVAPTNTDIVSWNVMSVSGGASVNNNSGTGDINETVDLPVGGKIVYTVILATHPNFSASTLTNTATVTPPSAVTDSDNSNNQDSDTNNSQPKSDLSITKTDGQSGYVPGSTVSYTVVVKNSGPSDASGSIVKDTAPGGTSISSWTAALHGGATGNTSGSGNLNETVNIPVGDSIVYTVHVAVPTGFVGILKNTATVSDASDSNNSNNSATDIDGTKADLSITKTDGQSSYTPGQLVTYTVTVENGGPNNVQAATVKEIAPTGTAITSWTATFTNASGTASGSGNINETVDINSGGKIVYTVQVDVPSDQTGKLTNTADVKAPTGVADPDLSNNTAKDIDTLDLKSDLSITKDDGQSTFSPGIKVTYTIVVENTGPSDATGATVVDNAPINTSIASWSAVTSNGASVNHSNGTGDINETVDVPVGGKITYTVQLSVPSDYGTGDLKNTAIVGGISDPNTSNNSATDIDNSQLKADLKISKSDGRSSYIPGAPLHYTIVVKNDGPSDVNNATVVDNAPTGTSITGWSATFSGGATGNTSGSSGNLSELVDISSGGSITYTIDLSVPSHFTGDLENTATVKTPGSTIDPDNSNNTAKDKDTMSLKADLSIQKTDGQSAFIPGTDVNYTITVRNTGPSDATNVKVKDIAPAGTSVKSWTATFTNASGNTSGVDSLHEMVDIQKGGKIVYNLKLNVPSDQTQDLVNTAEIEVPKGMLDPDLSNNKSSDKDTVSLKADVSITKDDGQSKFSPGDTLTYTIIVENVNGPSDVSGVNVADMAPMNTDIVGWSATASGGASSSKMNGTGDLHAVADLPVGSKMTYAVKLAVHSDFGMGDLSNTATIDLPSSVTDPDVSNNSATDKNINDAKADLSITKTDGHAGYLPGRSVTYTIQVKNNGPSDVSGAQVTDNAPTGTTITGWNAIFGGGATGTASGNGNLNESVDIPAGDSIVYMLDLSVPAGFLSDLINTVRVNNPSNVDDPNTSNNSATDKDTLGLVADLSVTKDDGKTAYTPGGTMTYTVVVENSGPDDAPGTTVEDTAPTGTSIDNWSATTAGGATVAHSTGTGNLNETVDIPVGGSVTYTIDISVPVGFTGDLKNTAGVTTMKNVNDLDKSDNTATDIDVHIPVAKDDSSGGNTPNSAVTLAPPVTDNDVVFGTAVLDPSTIDLDDANGSCEDATSKGCKAVKVPGQGTWTVDNNGNVTFSPEPGYYDDPDSIHYTVEDSDGNTSTIGTITVTYVHIPPTANDDQSIHNALTKPVTIDVLSNDMPGNEGSLVSSSVDLQGPSGSQCTDTDNKGRCKTLKISGEGTWDADNSGNVTFTPDPTFFENPTSISYVVADQGEQVSNVATITIDYITEHRLFIPNAFSPNGDGHNDIWKVKANNRKDVFVMVYNQYGQKLFESKDPSIGWDGRFEGRLQPSGVYVYFVKITFLNGTKTTKKGSITLIR